MDADCQYGCTAASEEGWRTRRAKPLSFMRARLAHGAGHWMLEAETLGDRLHSAQLAPLDGDLPDDDWRASPRHHGDHGPQLAVDDDELPGHHEKGCWTTRRTGWHLSFHQQRHASGTCVAELLIDSIQQFACDPLLRVRIGDGLDDAQPAQS